MSRCLVLVVPGDVDDAGRPSGGNTYDRRVRAELGRLGWRVGWVPVPGAWPDPDTAALTGLDAALRRLPAGTRVLLDGLVACAAPDVVVPLAEHLRLVVLVHAPLGLHGPAAYAREGPVLRAAEAVVATSAWSAQWLRNAYALRHARLHVARPGADPAPVAPGTAAGGRLLCVASVVPGKGHDVLVDALARLTDLDWTCECVGSTERDPAHAARVQDAVVAAGLAPRVRLTGPRTGAALDVSFATADLLVLPTRAETWGMVVTEALARGMPVVATDVGGVPEALGVAVGGTVPGLLVPADDPGVLAAALRRWLLEPPLREQLRDAALLRRAEQPGWDRTAADLVAALVEVAA